MSRRHEREGLTRGQMQRIVNMSHAMWCKPTSNFTNTHPAMRFVRLGYFAFDLHNFIRFTIRRCSAQHRRDEINRMHKVIALFRADNIAKPRLP
jgi:hypothetical protein